MHNAKNQPGPKTAFRALVGFFPLNSNRCGYLPQQAGSAIFVGAGSHTVFTIASASLVDVGGGIGVFAVGDSEGWAVSVLVELGRALDVGVGGVIASGEEVCVWS